MKILAVALFAVFLIGCDKQTREVSGEYALPGGLQDCKIFYLTGGGGGGLSLLKVMRCPNSSTSTNYTSGKTTHTNVVIEGVEYTPVPH